VRPGRRAPTGRLDVGDEPDPRFTLANERTFLAWARTALGLLVAGLAVAELLDSEARAARLVISVPLILMAGVIGLMSYPRWRTLERSLRLGRPLPYASAAAPLRIAIGVVAVAAIVVLVTD
jgi:putative membrane protein